MSPDSGEPRDAEAEDVLGDAELADDEEWDDGDDGEVERPRPSARRILAAVLAAMLVLLVAVPLAALTIPVVSDLVLLPRNGPDLLLSENEVPSGLRVNLDQSKRIDLGLDDSLASLARKAQLSAAGFGGGWVRTFEGGGTTDAVSQISTGVSVYRGADGARVEYARTIEGLMRDARWKAFDLGTAIGDEHMAFEQALGGGHAILVYYRYANLLAQVSLTYRGDPSSAFTQAQAAARTAAQKQVEKERLLRLRLFG